MPHHDIKEFVVQRATSASLWVCQCGWERCVPNHSFGPAIRDHFLMHYIVSGTGRYRNEHGEVRLKAGQGFFIPPGAVTFYEASIDDPWEYYWVGFKGVDAPALLEKCNISLKNPIFESTNTETLHDLFTKMFYSFNHDKAREYTMLAYFYLILSDLMEQNEKTVFSPTNSKLYLQSAVSYISDNYSYNISVSKIADYIGIDRTYLYRLFIENLGISPEKYIIKTRMTRAAALLKSTDLSVIEIALSSGYHDISHFSNIFKRFFKLSPTEFRKQGQSVI